MTAIDLNADVGEGCASDEALLAVVSSANIACGAHAGDAATMRRTASLCLQNGVGVGAHPGYADRANFGRLALNLSGGDVTALVLSQTRSLMSIAKETGTAVRHVKPHGALSNQAMSDVGLAQAIAAGVKAADPTLIFLVPSGSAMERAGRGAGLPVALEIFADRAYDKKGLIVPRSQDGAVLRDPRRIAERLARWLQSGRMETIDGDGVALTAQSVCVHGDTAEALAVASAVKERLAQAGVAIRPLHSLVF